MSNQPEFNRTLKEMGERIPELSIPFAKQVTRKRQGYRSDDEMGNVTLPYRTTIVLYQHVLDGCAGAKHHGDSGHQTEKNL